MHVLNTNRRVDAIVLMKESRGGKPHPVSGIEGPVGVEQELLEHFLSSFPRLPKIAAREVTSHRVSSQVVNPTLRKSSIMPNE